MKLAVTTLASPDWDLATVIERYSSYGYRAIDFRGCNGTMRLWELDEFAAQIGQTASRFADAGLEVTCISTGIRAAGATGEERAAMLDELTPTLEICDALDARQIRVFGGAFDEASISREQAIEHLGSNLRTIADRAADVGVDVLLETHDAWTASTHSLAAVRLADRTNVGYCWDIKHTFWVANETPLATWEMIGPLVRNTHWKDGRRGEQGRADRLCLLGEGQVPLQDAYQVLASGGYDGPYTLEWEKRWHPDIEEPEVALPHYLEYMTSLEAWRRRVTAIDLRLAGA